MKALILTLGVLAISATTHAGSLNYDFRGDYNSTSYNDAANTPAFQKFYIKTGRVYYKGVLNERISYDLRLGFYKPAVETATLNATRDNLNSSVEYANVTDKMSDMFSLTAGKFYTEIGGLEGATSGAELYMVTPSYSHSAVTTLTGKNLGASQSGANNLLYATGVKADFTFMDNQHIYLVATDNVGDSVDAAGKFNQNRGMMGAIYRGLFLDKALTAMVGYHEVSPQGPTTDSGNKHMFYAAGVKYDDASFIGGLEYNTTDYKDGLSGNKDTLWSALGKFGMKFDAWTPRLEVYSSEEKIGIGSTATNRFMGYGAVVEYKPTADNFRYHIAYNSITMQPATGNDLIKNEIVVGTRLFGDFLK